MTSTDQMPPPTYDDATADATAAPPSAEKKEVGGFGFRVGGSFVGVGVAPEGHVANGVGISLGTVMVGVTTGTKASSTKE